MDEVNSGNGDAGEQQESLSSLASPGERERWLDTMADMQIQADRRHKYLSDRLKKIEERLGWQIPEEMKTFLLMMALYVGVQLLLPFVIDQVEQWRSRSRS